MTIDAITAVSAVANAIEANAAALAAQQTDFASATSAAPATVAPASGDFGNWFAQEVQNVNQRLQVADTDIAKLASGQAPSLHEVMIHMEEAKLSLQLLAQVRNRLLDAYQEVMRMQV